MQRWRRRGLQKVNRRAEIVCVIVVAVCFLAWFLLYFLFILLLLLLLLVVLSIRISLFISTKGFVCSEKLGSKQASK